MTEANRILHDANLSELLVNMVWMCWKWLLTFFPPKKLIMIYLAKPLHSYRQTWQRRKAQWRKKKPKGFCSKLVACTRKKRKKKKKTKNNCSWSWLTWINGQVTPFLFPSLSLSYHPLSLFFSWTLLFPRYLPVWLSAAQLGVSHTSWGCQATWLMEHSPGCVVALFFG